jgi:heterodisulfide reductase subunit A-like polyferredoxin
MDLANHVARFHRVGRCHQEIGMNTSGGRQGVAIVGAGFAGLNAGLELANVAVNVSLIDRCNDHPFQLLRYQAA